MPKLPISRHDIVRLHHPPITSSHLKRQALPYFRKTPLHRPILPPAPGHHLPIFPPPLDLDVHDIPRTSNVEHRDENPVRVPVHLEPYAALLFAPDSPELDRDNPRLVFRYLEEHGHRQVKVPQRRVAPTALLLAVVGRAKVCCGYFYRTRPRNAPLWVINAHDLEAGATFLALVEQCRAQCRRV